MGLLLFHYAFRISIVSGLHCILVILIDLILIYVDLLLGNMNVHIVCVFKGNLLFKNIEHLVCCGILNKGILLHHFAHHLVIYHHVIHLLVKYLHWLGHIYGIEWVHLLIDCIWHFAEHSNNIFIVFHWFYFIAHDVHFYCSSLKV